MDSLSFQVSCADWIIGTGLYQVIGIPALSLTVLSETFDVIFLQFQFFFCSFAGSLLPFLGKRKPPLARMNCIRAMRCS